MKKGFLITFLAIVSSLCLQAQNTFEPTTHIGVTGGVNISGVNFKPFTRQEGYTSYSTGLVLRHISERISVFRQKFYIQGKDGLKAATQQENMNGALKLPNYLLWLFSLQAEKQ